MSMPSRTCPRSIETSTTLPVSIRSSPSLLRMKIRISSPSPDATPVTTPSRSTVRSIATSSVCPIRQRPVPRPTRRRSAWMRSRSSSWCFPTTMCATAASPAGASTPSPAAAPTSTTVRPITSRVTMVWWVMGRTFSANPRSSTRRSTASGSAVRSAATRSSSLSTAT